MILNSNKLINKILKTLKQMNGKKIPLKNNIINKNLFIITITIIKINNNKIIIIKMIANLIIILEALFLFALEELVLY